MKTSRKALNLFLVACFITVFSPLVFSDTVIKRIRCSDYHLAFENTAAFSKYIAVQIVRDGCRPKPGTSRFYVLRQSLTPGGPSLIGVQLKRDGKRTATSYMEIPPNGMATISFQGGPLGQRFTGTYDYVLTLD